jgi:MFS family permease
MDAEMPMHPDKSCASSGIDDRYGYVIVSSAFVLMVVMWTAFYSFGIFFKPVVNEFGWTRAVTAGAFSLCSVIQGLLAIAMGGLTDRFGPRLVMTICGVFLAAGYLLMSHLNSLWQLYLFFSIILGIGMGGSFAPLMTLTARWFVRRRGMMTGIVVSGTGLGALAGPPVAEILITHYGWRMSYSVLGAVVLVVMLLCAQLLKSAPGHMRTVGSAKDWQEGDGREIHQVEVTFHDAIRSGKFWVVFAMIFFLGFCIFAIMVHFAPHVTDLGFPQATAANIMATMGAVCIAGRVVFGKILDKIGSRKGFVIGFATMGLSFFVIVWASTLSMLYLFAVLFGFAFGACVTCESPLVADLFGLRSHGLILGVIACGFTFGGGVGPFVAGHIFDVVGRYRAAFLLCALVSCVALVLARTLKTPAPFRNNSEHAGVVTGHIPNQTTEPEHEKRWLGQTWM